ncbi:AsmA family protein [Scleromatobacter humisilvae]|uniref:AsmA family protein n=1 Tax=Scleromatobacter humisilvae TaxID=2897159 RepID=A0A9X1YQL6_9BURK|nr:AsmA family protein [Scleromatobacter humisilvae]MCK9689353.1 AsmA family protein [Scleromatobacter humisilvae]
MPGSTPTPARPPRRFRALRIALVVLLALVALCWAFDWNWCRPLIRHFVMSRSGRSFEFDDMKVHFRDGLDPTIEFRGLTIQNAPWAASKAPFIHAGHLAATISWRSIGSDLVIIPLIQLDDAQVDMERLADGLRNWRITRPDDRGPPRVRVLALDARNSRLHTIHRGLDLELDAGIAPLPASEPFEGHADLPLTKSLSFKGRFRDDEFEGSAHVSDVLAFGATSRTFTFKAQATSGALLLAASGLSNDVHALGDFDCDIRVTAMGTGPTKPLPEALARWRPLAARGHLEKSGDRWTGSDVRIRAGRHTTAIADGTFVGNFKNEAPRRTLKATLRDAVFDLDDLAAARAKPSSDDHLLSTQPLPLERLRDIDADIDLRPVRITGTAGGLVQGVRTRATLANGVLKLQALDATVADGHVVGALQVDASHSPADLSLDMNARGLHVEQLSTTLAANGALAGAIDGHAVLKSRGDSTRALVAAANGNVTLSLADGATVSRRVDAKLGLNGGEWLRTLFDKSARVPVQCATVTLALAHGIATPRRFVFETPDTALAVRGSLDIVNETIDATLTPAHKKLALLALDKSVHAEGAWHGVKFALVPASGDPPERCPR